ncbi:22704_t:CDS:2, partial [Gigaspora margarita]
MLVDLGSMGKIALVLNSLTILVYFAKVIADYATIIKHEKGYTSSPRRTEESNMTNNQVVT